jgi:WD40 repeat protein
VSVRAYTALLLLPLAPLPFPRAAGDDPPPVLRLRAELGGGDTNWTQMGVYAPDGQTLYAVAGGPNGGLVYAIDPAAGRKLATLKADPPADAARGYPTGLAISPDGKYLAVAYQSVSKDAGAGLKELGWELILWDLAERNVAASQHLRRERWELKHLAFSPDGKRLAGNSYGYSKEIDWYQSVAVVWDAPGLAQKHALAVRGHGFSALAFTLTGDVLRAFHDGFVRRWDLAAGKALPDVTFDHGTRRPSGPAAFSPDGKTVAVLSGVSDNRGLAVAAELSLFDAERGGKARSVARGHKSDADRITYSADGKRIATAVYGASDVVLWDADNLAILATLPTYGHLAFAPNGKTLNIGGTGFWGVEGRHLFTMGRHMTQVWAVAAHPKGGGYASAQNVPVIRFWDRATLKNTVVVAFDPGGRTMTRSMAYSPDGLTLAAGYGDHIKFLNPENGWVKFTAEGHTSGVNAVAFSPDGKHFASASGAVRWVKDEPRQDPGEVIIWEVERETARAKPVHTIKAHPAGTFSLAFSPDGKTLAAGGGDPAGRGFVEAPAAEAATKEAVKLFDVATGKPTAAFPCDPRHHVNALAWSPDGKTLAHTGIDGTRVRLLDPATGRERALLQAPTQALAFSPNGALLAAVGYGGKGNGQGLIELWDAATAKKVASVVGHDQVVNCVAFTPDGKSLVTGSSDGVMNLWDVNPPKK